MDYWNESMYGRIYCQKQKGGTYYTVTTTTHQIVTKRGLPFS